MGIHPVDHGPMGYPPRSRDPAKVPPIHVQLDGLAAHLVAIALRFGRGRVSALADLALHL
jgi:hypothetical protein